MKGYLERFLRVVLGDTSVLIGCCGVSGVWTGIIGNGKEELGFSNITVGIIYLQGQGEGKR